MNRTNRHLGSMVFAMLLIAATSAWAQTTSPQPPAPAATTPPAASDPAPAPVQASKTSLEIYGFAMLDIGHNFNSIHPNWFDTMRVAKLPKFEDEYGKEGSAFAGVRQTRFGVKTTTPTSAGELKTTFEFEMFGVGVDEGQTTIRLRHAYGELGKVGAGQTWSVFMDPDVFPNSAEYWGPTGMVFFRNVQLRFYAVKKDKQSLILALEKPGSSGDPGTLADRVEIQNIRGRNPMLDFTGAYTRNFKLGYFRAAGVVRKIAWDDLLDDQFDLSGDAVGWGLNFSSNLKLNKEKTLLRLQYMFGEGVENYMNDSPVDVGIESNPGNTLSPIKGVPLPIKAWVAMVDHTINSKWSTTFGYSRQDIDNSELQAPNAFKTGDYFIANIGHYPAPNVMILGEYQWGRRTNFSDGWTYDGNKIQFSFKYNFSLKLGG
jgi:DcaP outer membrane protein